KTVPFYANAFAADGARTDSPPVQARLPLVIGGSGEKRTLRIVAETADIWNADADTPESFARRNGILDEHCQAVGRDPATIERTVGLPPPLIRARRDQPVEALTGILERHAVDRGAARRAAEASPFADTSEGVIARLSAY